MNPFQFEELDANPDPVEVDLLLENSGTSNDLTISDTSTISGTAAGNFSIVTPLPLTLAPKATTELKLRFDDLDQFGQFDASLSLASNDPSNAKVKVSLSIYVPSADGSQLANGDFEESEQSLSKWMTSANPDQAATPEAGFAPGSKISASIAAGQTLSQNVRAESAWYTDFYFRIMETGSRALNYVIRYQGGEVNIRIQTSGESSTWNTFTEEDGWGDTLELPPIEPDTTYFMRVVGHDWEGVEPTYDLLVSDPEGTELVHKLVGQDRFRSSIPTAGPTSVLFTAVFGGNPGFMIDDARFENGSPPENENPFPLEITAFDFHPSAQMATITWTTKPGVTYSVQASSDLQEWLELDDGVAENVVENYTEENVTSPIRHYRVVNSQ